MGTHVGMALPVLFSTTGRTSGLGSLVVTYDIYGESGCQPDGWNGNPFGCWCHNLVIDPASELVPVFWALKELFGDSTPAAGLKRPPNALRLRSVFSVIAIGCYGVIDMAWCAWMPCE
jgi:hypothetical protein